MADDTNGRENQSEEQAGPQKKKPGGKRPREVRLYPSWCKRCGICTAFCPTGALERTPDGRPVWKYPEKCIGCGICQLRCPDFAIEVVTDEEPNHE